MITSSSKMNISQTIYAILAGTSFILTFIYSETAIECARSALSLCAKTIIPSLFPFIIISEIVVYSGLGNVIGSVFSKLFNKLFGISAPAVCAVILGALCGFPIGTKIVLSLLDSGSIDKSEAERLITFCNNPSPSFLINIVGLSLYSSSVAGVIFYCVTLMNSALIGIISNMVIPCPSNHFKSLNSKKPHNTLTFASAVSSSIPSILSICSYVIFFSVLMGCIEKILTSLNCTKNISIFIYSIIELSGGVAKSATLGNNILGLCITSFGIGWSGLSVHCQMQSLCNGYNLNLKNYFISKLILGFMNSLAIALIYHFMPSFFFPCNSTISVIYLPGLHEAWSIFSVCSFAIGTTFYILRRKHKSTVSIIY